jgi:hypothetical protein
MKFKVEANRSSTESSNDAQTLSEPVSQPDVALSAIRKSATMIESRAAECFMLRSAAVELVFGEIDI